MRKTILFIDDDPSWQFNYEEILLDEGYAVVVVGSKEDAMKIISQKVFDVAIVDLRLVDSDPKNKDGIDVIRRMRQISPKTPIIVKSGYLDLDARDQLHKLKISNDNILDKLDEQGQRRKLIDLLRSIFRE